MKVRTEVEIVQFGKHSEEIFRMLGYRVVDGVVHFNPAPDNGAVVTFHSKGPQITEIEIAQGQNSFVLHPGDYLARWGRLFFPMRRDDVAHHLANLIPMEEV